MSRPLRIEFPGALYHVTTRGNARQDIFLDSDDARLFLRLLAEACQRHDWRVYAYCLMTNHYHLVVETRIASLSPGMRRLNGVYTQAFNRRHRRTGHLFQGRYKAILVEAEAYLQELCRYVLLNPVRGGLAKKARDWRWSSYRDLVEGPAPDWLDREAVLALFGRRPKAAARTFAAFVDAGVGERRVWDALKGGIYLGSDAFMADMQARAGAAGASGEVPRSQRSAPPRPPSWFAQHYAEPHEAMARAHLEGGHSQAGVARHFDVHYSTVSRAAARFAGGTEGPEGG